MLGFATLSTNLPSIRTSPNLVDITYVNIDFVVPAKGGAGVSAWTQAACGTVRACKPERALRAGTQVMSKETTWIPAFAGMTNLWNLIADGME